MIETPNLDRLVGDEPPTAADSDLIGIAIIRLQRAQARMQDHQYDAITWEHMEKAAEFLGWVASNWRRRNREADRDPLVVIDTRQMGDAGKRVQVECREPSSCLSVGLYGQSVAVNAAVEALERIHQSAHALREEPQ